SRYHFEFFGGAITIGEGFAGQVFPVGLGASVDYARKRMGLGAARWRDKDSVFHDVKWGCLELSVVRDRITSITMHREPCAETPALEFVEGAKRPDDPPAAEPELRPSPLKKWQTRE